MRFRQRQGGLLAIVLLSAVALGAWLTAPAMAAEQTSETQSVTEKLLDQLDTLQSMQVEEDVCGKCHASFDPRASFTAEIKFSHGYHLTLQCADCHTKFPHQRSGTQRPTMKICMNCHGLRHGPQGVIAKGGCDSCHVTPKAQKACPNAATAAWIGSGHVAKARTETTRDCMMCHSRQECQTCHTRHNIDWAPKDGWSYDPGEATPKSGCYACHANSTLLAPKEGANYSFQITTVSDSVHHKLTCQQCHPDFRYDDAPAATEVWNVNAGLQCGNCHKALKDKRLSEPVAQYEQSVHAEKIRSGDLSSATCASCHPAHDIYSLRSSVGKAKMRGGEFRVCKRCHEKRYESFDDYYHGQPYKKGAPDAPSCWQCHGAHEVLGHQEDRSMVSSANIGKTCGQEGCHKGSTEKFADQASELIHRKGETREENWLVQQVTKVKGVFGLN